MEFEKVIEIINNEEEKAFTENNSAKVNFYIMIFAEKLKTKIMEMQIDKFKKINKPIVQKMRDVKKWRRNDQC